MATTKLVFDRKKIATLSTAQNPKTGLVQIELTSNGKRQFITTGVKVYKDQWGGPAKMVVRSAYSSEYNGIIVEKMKQVIDAAADGKPLNLPKKVKSMAMLADWLDEAAGKIANKRSKNRAKAVFQYARIITRFVKNMRLEAISLVWGRKLQDKLLDQYASGSVRGMMAFLKQALNMALEDGIIANNPLSTLKLVHADYAQRTILTQDEVDAFANVHTNKKITETAKQLFMFQCYTGLAYADAISLTPQMFSHENGKVYIIRTRQKTGVPYRITLLPPALKIAEAFNFSSPQISIAEYNKNIKRLAKLAGITKNVSSHTARHTFATWALRNGVPIEIVSKMLGHTNITTTQIYAKILAQDVDAQFDKLASLCKTETQLHS